MEIDLKRVLALFFPARCQYCRKVISYGKVICGDCRENVKRQVYLQEISVGKEEKVEVISPFIYEKEVRKSICAFKFNGKVELSEHLAESMAFSVKEYYGADNFDFVTAVPMTDKSYLKRGYNQAEILARHAALQLGVPYVEALKKIKENKKQHTLSKTDREENIRGVYEVIDENLVFRKKILLCDDIITTGSTLSECAKELIAVGAKSIKCATVAKVKFCDKD